MKKVILFCIIVLLLMSGINVIATGQQSPLKYNTSLDDHYDLLIITPTNFIDELIPLKNHKEQHELPTIIVTLDDIYNNTYFPSNGRDNPEKIKNFIKNALDEWNISYVLLVGGKNEMPVRYSNAPINSGQFISDVYYADIYDRNGSFCSWDSNNNSVFGELGYNTAIDDVDLYPDICIGRILCQTSDEVTIVVNKIIDYENHAFGSEWFSNLILCGGDTHPYTWEELLLSIAFKNITGLHYRPAWEGEYMGNQVANCLDTFTAKKFYSSGLFGVRAKSLTNRNINQAINDGAGFLLFSMHGSPTKIVTYPPFNKKQWIQLPFPSGYNISEVQHLTNGGKLPVAVFCACSNGDFDTVPDPIAWAFVQQSTGGSIASFALTTEGNIFPTTMYTKTLTGHTTMSVFKAYADGVNCLGKIWAETITRYLDDKTAWSVSEHLIDNNGASTNWVNYVALEQWILFGDPSLRIGGYP